MKKLLCAIALLTTSFATCVSAYAADLPMEPVYKAPMVAQQVYNWTGFYIGANGGYGWGHQDPFNILSSRFDPFSVPFTGGMLGGTVGAQIQTGHVVLGVEADIDWAKINGSANVVPTIGGALPGGCLGAVGCASSLTTNITSVSTGRLRVGYALDNWLLYGTGGLALLEANTSRFDGRRRCMHHRTSLGGLFIQRFADRRGGGCRHRIWIYPQSEREAGISVYSRGLAGTLKHQRSARRAELPLRRPLTRHIEEYSPRSYAYRCNVS